MSRTTLTDGSPVPDDRSHEALRPDGQQKGYVILSDEERAKGFIRPVRESYVHIGPPEPLNLRDLTPEEHERYDQYGYVKFEPNTDPDSAVTGTYWTQARLDRLGSGCGHTTTMGRSLAETYARQPDFYSGTFCAHCRNHFPVGEKGEFIWSGTDERVGT